MSDRPLKYALALSLLLNAGFIGGAAYQAAKSGGLLPVPAEPVNAADYLKLTPEQRERWRALESDFMREFESEARQIAAHREKLVRGIFSAGVPPDRIEAERQAIARLQARQQQRVIAQLMKEREILDVAQQQALAELLLKQAPHAVSVESLHRK